MGTPSRTSILLDIQSSLTAITTGNGYKTTVDTVETFLRGRDDVPTGQMPYVCFGLDPETYEHQAYHNMRVTSPLYIGGIIEEATWATASDKINDLIDDIIVAIMSDDTLGGNATQTKLIRVSTDETDADRGKTVACELEFEVTYYRETTAS